VLPPSSLFADLLAMLSDESTAVLFFFALVFFLKHLLSPPSMLSDQATAILHPPPLFSLSLSLSLTYTHTHTPQDVTLILAAQGTVRAHRNILCARCSYFRDVLEKEGGGVGVGGGAVITMTDASEAAMRVVLQYL
jgi:hypothetical protein